MKHRQSRFSIKIVIGILVVLLLLGPQMLEIGNFAGQPLLSPTALAQMQLKTLDVKAFGAKGDGLTDDTGAIQSAIQAAGSGTRIYFPVGTYLVGNFLVHGRSNLWFSGEGRNSVIKRADRGSRIATFDRVSDITISQLAFDANGVSVYGGVAFFSASRIVVENNWFVDSAPKALGVTDRYALVFGKGASPSQDIQILDNTIEDLQLEVDHARRVVIDGNSVMRAVQAAGIGVFSVGNGSIAEDYQITRNRIVNPHGSAISVLIDPPTSRNCVFRRITIAHNQVIQNERSTYGMRIGTGNSAQSTTGNIFEDIVITDNWIRVGSAPPASRQLIYANTSTAAGFVFQRLTVARNTIRNDGPASDYFAIDLRRLQNSRVAGNTLTKVRHGISFERDLLSNEVHYNSVQATDLAYNLNDSLGYNKASDNLIAGNPRMRWKLSRLQPSDVIEQ